MCDRGCEESAGCAVVTEWAPSLSVKTAPALSMPGMGMLSTCGGRGKSKPSTRRPSSVARKGVSGWFEMITSLLNVVAHWLSSPAFGSRPLNLLRRLVELLSHPIGELLIGGFRGPLPGRPLRMSAAKRILFNESFFRRLLRTASAVPFSAPWHQVNHRYQEYSVKLFSLQCNFHLDFCNAVA